MRPMWLAAGCAVALSAFYVVVTAWLARRRDRLALLFESTLALAVICPISFTRTSTRCQPPAGASRFSFCVRPVMHW